LTRRAIAGFLFAIKQFWMQIKLSIMRDNKKNG
jgi:hypothetical protein